MIARLPIQTNEMDKTIVIGPLFSTYFLHFSNRLGLGVKISARREKAKILF